MSIKKKPGKKEYNCPVEVTMDVIGGRWKTLIVYRLENSVLRFSQLQKLIPGITQRMLTRQLRELEKDGIVERIVYPEIPPRVEYRLTELGKTVLPIKSALCSWGCMQRKTGSPFITTEMYRKKSDIPTNF